MSDAITRARIANPPWRWVARENIHVTLKFLGDTPEEIVPELVEVVTGACAGTAPFDIVLGGLGGFPNLKRPRVLFYEVTTGARELVALAGAIDAALSEGLGDTAGGPPVQGARHGGTGEERHRARSRRPSREGAARRTGLSEGGESDPHGKRASTATARSYRPVKGIALTGSK